MTKTLSFLLLLGVAAFSASVHAADRAPVGPQAAKLHRSGDTAGAIAIWLPLARNGDVNAAYNLAVIHDYGDGVARDPAEALKWYRVAAERGDRASQSRLGTMYLNGEGTARNKKEGWRWINAHRVAHLHHDHHPQMAAWREQAAKLIQERDMREAMAASRATGDQVLADLRRRAGTTVAAQPPAQLAAAPLQAAR